MDEFLSEGERQNRALQFEQLKQKPGMTVIEYAQEFKRLSRYAAYIVPTEASKVERFRRGLIAPLYNALVATDFPTLAKLIDKAKLLETRHKAEKAERAEREQKGKGKSKGVGKGSLKGKEQAATVPVPYSVQGGKTNRNLTGKASVASAPGGSMVQRTGQQGQVAPVCTLCGKRHGGVCRRATGACIACGQMGHFIKDCPMKNEPRAGAAMSQPTVQMSRVENRTQGNRGKGQTRQSGAVQAVEGKAKGRVFALNQQEARASTTAVTGTLSVQNFKARCLFDSGATHSFVSPYFAKKMGITKVIMNEPLIITTPLGETIEVQYEYRNCIIELEFGRLSVNLIELEILEFDVILGMDWLSSHNACIDCKEKKVVFKRENGTEVGY